jgi:hypothetical protein
MIAAEAAAKQETIAAGLSSWRSGQMSALRQLRPFKIVHQGGTMARRLSVGYERIPVASKGPIAPKAEIFHRPAFLTADASARESGPKGCWVGAVANPAGSVRARDDYLDTHTPDPEESCL